MYDNKYDTRYLISSNTPQLVLWDSIIGVALIYTGLFTPWEIAFLGDFCFPHFLFVNLRWNEEDKILRSKSFRIYNTLATVLPSKPKEMGDIFRRREERIGRSLSPSRNFFGRFSLGSWASVFFLSGWRTASISSFPFRHGASWWNSGFMEAMNLMRGFGGERAAPGSGLGRGRAAGSASPR